MYKHTLRHDLYLLVSGLEQAVGHLVSVELGGEEQQRQLLLEVAVPLLGGEPRPGSLQHPVNTRAVNEPSGSFTITESLEPSPC